MNGHGVEPENEQLNENVVDLILVCWGRVLEQVEQVLDEDVEQDLAGSLACGEITEHLDVLLLEPALKEHNKSCTFVLSTNIFAVCKNQWDF